MEKILNKLYYDDKLGIAGKANFYWFKIQHSYFFIR